MKRVLVMLCAVALALNANAQEVSATYDPDVEGDNNIGRCHRLVGLVEPFFGK